MNTRRGHTWKGFQGLSLSCTEQSGHERQDGVLGLLSGEPHWEGQQIFCSRWLLPWGQVGASRVRLSNFSRETVNFLCMSTTISKIPQTNQQTNTKLDTDQAKNSKKLFCEVFLANEKPYCYLCLQPGACQLWNILGQRGKSLGPYSFTVSRTSSRWPGSGLLVGGEKCATAGLSQGYLGAVGK